MENTIVIRVDNRSLVLALDYLYRENMKIFEVEQLLLASRDLIRKLSLSIIDTPIEGYYHESDELREYFLNIRSLQKCTDAQRKAIAMTEAYQLISSAMSSEIYGRGKNSGFFPQRLDSLYYALEQVPVIEWKVDTITSKAYAIAAESDDLSLVGIAAFIKDPVVLAALRESVALYGAVAVGSAIDPPKIIYEWHVDKEVQSKVNRFINIFNKLTSSSILEATPNNLEYFYDAFANNNITGRCIYVGYDDSKDPIENYHWAIKYEGIDFVVDDFWSTEIWTSERYENEKLCGSE